ncbi:Uncharacterized protein TCM_011339 [Theobroma cacao]|uniref:Uncharacterized protein n=1 Tax=Theobroma cacao TaxID=3641 RepID=A0A061EGN0_THECC|nr:Uncharacterized protein TCM_011339 [Theobroma cacao]
MFLLFLSLFCLWIVLSGIVASNYWALGDGFSLLFTFLVHYIFVFKCYLVVKLRMFLSNCYAWKWVCLFSLYF